MRGPLIGRSALLLGFALLAGAESIFFGREVVASLERLVGQHAFFGGDYAGAWRHYAAALDSGEDPIEGHVDQVELLLAGLEQRDVGIRWRLTMPHEQALRTAYELVVDVVRRAPQRAYSWSLASDVYFEKAREVRRAAPIDLGALSDNPMENLLPQEWLGLACLQAARHQDPNNYNYADILAEAYLGYGMLDRGARACRAAVAAYPVLSAHLYLSRPDVPADLVEAAAAGFEDALGSTTLVPPASIEEALGRFLAEHGQDERALPHLRRAVSLAPDHSDAHYHLGMVAYRRKDYDGARTEFSRAAALVPESPWPHYYMGLCALAQGETDKAISSFREAKLRLPLITFFHALGETYEQNGQIEEAERQYAAAANLNSEEPSAWGTLLAFYLRQKNWKGISESCARLQALGRGDLYRDECSPARPVVP